LLLRRWGWGIAIIGVAVLASGIQRLSVLEIVVGSLLVVIGAVAWIRGHGHRIGWLISALGIAAFTVGWYGGTLLGIAVAPRTLALLILGPILILAGGFLRAALLARRRVREAMARPPEDISPFLDDGPPNAAE
jgi:hypothetical protein